jgi:hypothetical protein
MGAVPQRRVRQRKLRGPAPPRPLSCLYEIIFYFVVLFALPFLITLLDPGIPSPEFCPKPELSPLLYTYDPLKQAFYRTLLPWELK